MWKKIINVMFLVIILVLIAGVILFGRQMTLVPAEPVRVVADIDSLNSVDPAKTLAVIPKGVRVQVTGCRNLVDDQVYRVKTITGAEGYVAGGRFKIEKKPFWSSPRGKIVVCY